MMIAHPSTVSTIAVTLGSSKRKLYIQCTFTIAIAGKSGSRDNDLLWELL
jgi:hypothetical protein